MEQTSKRVEIARNFLILAALLGIVSFGWLAGHILRHITPAFEVPSIEEIDPHIENGSEFEGIRRQVVLTGIPAARLPGDEEAVVLGEFSVEQCQEFTYYTSLPAKCRTTDGRLARVGGNGMSIFIIPPAK